MLNLIVLLALALGAYALYRYTQRRRQLHKANAASLKAAAKALNGQIEQDDQTGRRRVIFSEQGHNFALSREAAPADDKQLQDMFVVELKEDCSALPSFDLRSKASAAVSLTAHNKPANPVNSANSADAFDLNADDEGSAFFQQKISAGEATHLIRYALDHKDARLHFSPKGVWFECAGFADNGELAAATARTAARALAVFLPDKK